MKDVSRFENQDRLDEVNIEKVMELAHVKEQDVICDYGAGTGIFTKSMAKSTRNKVYALDMSQDMLSHIQKKIKEEALDNIVLQKVEADRLPLDPDSIDVAFIITVFHHIGNMEGFITELKDCLKPGGRVAVVEFHKKDSPSGPPGGMRLSPEELNEVFVAGGFRPEAYEVLGDNMYVCVYLFLVSKQR